MNEPLEVLGICGPAKFFKTAAVRITTYPADGAIALIANPGTEDQQTYTVCLVDSNAPIKPGHVWLKGWGANEGAPEALVDAGLVKLTGNKWPTGYVEAQEAELLVGGH